VRREMEKISTTAEVKTYDDSKPDKITIKSHWNIGQFVKIEIDGKAVVVDGNALREAVRKCMNV
jgi:hypothetical protein